MSDDLHYFSGYSTAVTLHALMKFFNRTHKFILLNALESFEITLKKVRTENLFCKKNKLNLVFKNVR